MQVLFRQQLIKNPAMKAAARAPRTVNVEDGEARGRAVEGQPIRAALEDVLHLEVHLGETCMQTRTVVERERERES